MLGVFTDSPTLGCIIIANSGWACENPEELQRQKVNDVQPDSFLPRVLYGKYLSGLLDQASNLGGCLRRIAAEAIDVAPQANGLLRHLKAFWEAHRHRAAPEVLELKSQLEKEERSFVTEDASSQFLRKKISFLSNSETQMRTRTKRYASAT